MQHAQAAIGFIPYWKIANATFLPTTALMLKSLLPVARFTTLMSNSKYLRSKVCIFFVHHCEGKAVEVVNPQPILPMRAALLIFDQQLNKPFKLGQERVCNGRTGPFGIKRSSLTQSSVLASG